MAVRGLLFRRRAVFLAAAGVLSALLVVLALALDRGRAEETGGVTGSAPAFSLPTLQGGNFALAEHATGPIFVYFWASWCTPCKAEAPVIQRLWEQHYKDRGYTFVAVNMWDTEQEARRFVQEYGLTFPAVRDEGGKVYLAYGVERLPMAFGLRPGLIVEERFLGTLEEEQLRELLDRLEGRT
jgi:cytochrome c biogenesis protein CcmG, thiol:disulfide interchange protein DsbE